MSSKMMVIVAVFCVTIAPSVGWSGCYISRTVQEYRTKQMCVLTDPKIGCTEYQLVDYSVYRITYDCRNGWIHNGDENCNIPLCNPPCRNDGVCTQSGNCGQENHCVCKFPSTNDCGGNKCSVQTPCYPGTCSNANSCQCAVGFHSSQDGCLQYSLNSNLEIYQFQVSLSFWQLDVYPSKECYSVVAISNTKPGNAQNKTVWTRYREFNQLDVDSTSQFSPFPISGMPPLPDFISEARFGIVHGELQIAENSVNMTVVNCTQQLTDMTPESGLYFCSVTTSDFKDTFEHGDILTITLKINGGGYRKLQSPNGTEDQIYRSTERDLPVHFKFDFQAPTHCLETKSCTSGSMLSASDVTNTAIRISWDGWTDRDSGVELYILQVFKMCKTTNDTDELQVQSGVHPVYSEEFRTSLAFINFTPKEAGMYSVVLEVSDGAGNTKCVRRMSLYDPNSTVTTDPKYKLYVSSATEFSNYSYQTSNTAIVVQWVDYFRNDFHERNSLLGRVLEFPEKLGNITLDDREGIRSISAVPNVRGIVNFEIKLDWNLTNFGNPDLRLGVWTNVSLATNYTLPPPEPYLGTLTAYVKATDIIGNSNIKSTKVTFDSTPPVASGLVFIQNVPGGDFRSRISLTAYDSESGIAYVNWTFLQNGSIIYENTMHLYPAQSCNNSTACYCTAQTHCFTRQQNHLLYNCDLITKLQFAPDETVIAQVYIVNLAGQISNTQLEINDLQNLNGTDSFYPPENVEVNDIAGDSVNLTWSNPPSCFDRLEILANVSGKILVIPKDRQQYDVTELSPVTNYTILLSIVYVNGETSDQVSVSFTTGIISEEGSVSLGLIIGVVIGIAVVLLLLLFVLIFIMRKKNSTRTRKSLLETETRPCRDTGPGDRSVRPETVRYITATEMHQHVSDKEQKDCDANPYSNNDIENYVQSKQEAMTSFEEGEQDIPLVDEEWFHGVLPRDEIQRLLVKDGDYLVRESKDKKTNESNFVLSVFWQSPRHFIINGSEKQGWRVGGAYFPSIQKLIHHHASGAPITTKNQPVQLKYPVLRENWQLSNDQIKLENKIGNGNFGDVFKGIYLPKKMTVAVKTCRDHLSEDQRKNFLLEGRILKQYDHPNIVRFIGIAAQRQPIMIVMEYVPGGDLLKFLRKEGSKQSHEEMIRMCMDAANGMAYLEERGCIHRDLAARNCLVGEENVVKISDFGMSREEEEYTASNMGKRQIPIKWTAPEAIAFGKYTSQSDVWSYGVLMWEIFNAGQNPYTGMNNTEARQQVENGYRLPQPSRMQDDVYELLLRCWDAKPEKRPTFKELYGMLDNNSSGA